MVKASSTHPRKLATVLGIQSFLFGVILQTAGIVVQYAFWQFLTPISLSFVRNPGLVSIGVNFSSQEVQSALEAGSYGLEDALRSTIDYVLWLHQSEKQIFPNAILIRALVEQWKPKAWRDDYLELPMLESPGQRWWNAAASMWGYDTRNQLVADVCYLDGREFIKFTNGKEITVETAWRWEWERVLKYATS